MIRFDENLYMGYEGKTICRILGIDKININWIVFLPLIYRHSVFLWGIRPGPGGPWGSQWDSLVWEYT